MEFDFISLALGGDQHISIWDSERLRGLSKTDNEYISTIVEIFGKKSAVAQDLGLPVTDMNRLRTTDQKLFLCMYRQASKTVVLGGLKIGHKKLFVRNGANDLIETSPLCILDFYVHESCQRQGIGKQLFECCCEVTKTHPAILAYDRPSPKLLGFLKKHYGLWKYVPQSNSFVVFDDYFTMASGGGPTAAQAIAGLSARRGGGPAQQQQGYPSGPPTPAYPGSGAMPRQASYSFQQSSGGGTPRQQQQQQQQQQGVPCLTGRPGNSLPRAHVYPALETGGQYPPKLGLPSAAAALAHDALLPKSLEQAQIWRAGSTQRSPVLSSPSRGGVAGGGSGTTLGSHRVGYMDIPAGVLSSSTSLASPSPAPVLSHSVARSAGVAPPGMYGVRPCSSSAPPVGAAGNITKAAGLSLGQRYVTNNFSNPATGGFPASGTGAADFQLVGPSPYGHGPAMYNSSVPTGSASSPNMSFGSTDGHLNFTPRAMEYGRPYSRDAQLPPQNSSASYSMYPPSPYAPQPACLSRQGSQQLSPYPSGGYQQGPGNWGAVGAGQGQSYAASAGRPPIHTSAPNTTPPWALHDHSNGNDNGGGGSGAGDSSYARYRNSPTTPLALWQEGPPPPYHQQQQQQQQQPWAPADSSQRRAGTPSRVQPPSNPITGAPLPGRPSAGGGEPASLNRRGSGDVQGEMVPGYIPDFPNSPDRFPRHRFNVVAADGPTPAPGQNLMRAASRSKGPYAADTTGSAQVAARATAANQRSGAGAADCLVW